MAPASRNYVACLLGWTTPQHEPSFGDAHKEAWEIISRPMSGMQVPAALPCHAGKPRLRVLSSECQ